jgi:hypothetical protein
MQLATVKHYRATISLTFRNWISVIFFLVIFPFLKLHTSVQMYSFLELRNSTKKYMLESVPVAISVQFAIGSHTPPSTG